MPLREAVSALLLGVVWLIEVVRVFVPDTGLAKVGLACLAAFTALAITRASRHIAVLFTLAMAAGVAVAAWRGNIDNLVTGLSRAQIFGAFLPSVLLLRATAEASPRIQRVREDLGGLDLNGAKTWTQYGSHAIGAVLNVGAMAIIAPVVSRGRDVAERLELARASARGVGGGVMWSPFFVCLAFTSALVPRAPMWQSMIVSGGLALMGFALSYLLFTRGLGRSAFRASIARLQPVIAPMGFVIGAVVAVSLVFHWNGLQAVAIVVPLLCLAYMAVLGPSRSGAVARRAVSSIGKLADEMVIVVGATVLGAAVAALPAVQRLGAGVTPDMISGPLLIGALVALLVAVGQLGLHPMIGVSLAIPVVATGDFGVAGVALVCSAAFAWGLTASVSIWTLPVAVAAGAFGVPAAQMLSRRALAFLLVYMAAGIGYLSAMNAVLRAMGLP